MLTVKPCKHSICTMNFNSFRFKFSRPKFLPLEKQIFRIKNDKNGILNTVHWTETHNNQAKYYLLQKWNSQLVISREKIARKFQCWLRIHEWPIIITIITNIEFTQLNGGGVSPIHCATAGFHGATPNRKSSAAAAATKTNSHRSIFRHVAFGFLMNGGN